MEWRMIYLSHTERPEGFLDEHIIETLKASG